MSDLISRQAAIRIASGYCHFTNVAKELEKLPSVQPVDKDINVSCKDAISRQAAIDALAKFVPYAICDESTESYTNGLTDAYNLILQLPSVQPEDCDTCKHGYFGDDQCERCRVRYPSHYERRTDGEIIPE